MEALVYEESPLARYLEPREPARISNPQTSTSPSFAPRGYATLRNRLQHVQRRATGLASADDEKVLEHFRYLVIASQLLEGPCRLRPPEVEGPGSLVERYTVTGAALTAALSFVVVWALSTTRRRSMSGSEWSKYGVLVLVCLASLAVVVVFGQRRYAQYVRQNATSTLSHLIHESHLFDGVFSPAIKLVQEVEVLARGYELNNPLPPVTRFEQDTPEQRCAQLREVLADTVASLTSHFVEAHNRLLQFTSEKDLRQYHEIYDISLSDYSHAVSLLNTTHKEPGLTLRDLRFAYNTFILTRKVLLCDLLALPSRRQGLDTLQWLAVSGRMQILNIQIAESTKSIQHVLQDEESKGWTRESVSDSEVDGEHENHISSDRKQPPSPGSQQTLAKQRRLDGLATGVRALNAKIHLFRQEADRVASADVDSGNLGSTLSKQYDILGADIKSLLHEWEQGKRTMMLNIDRLSRYSRSSSGIRSPMSPSPSLGGLTMIDDGPGDALKALTGDDSHQKMSDFGASDEEVFEAVALPRKRLSVALSREERIAKMQEDRKKRTTVHEHAERTTNMLRELEMVIKHRPRGQTASRIASV